MGITSTATHHLVVICPRCGKDAQFCPRRYPSNVQLARAAEAYERAGWHQDACGLVRMGQTKSDRDYGAGTWYCPECARARP